ncbi:hypothetical protein MED134_03189 [Dokdonia sp. MED134]|uniref:YaaC family protein n=1 Tax=Dokdonia sp. MED134 TaxID=313590 RepID=UPI0000689BB3|nr:YaaC family protein [Dokdonia sp. MED134]EAQ38283.1 hypothetical protein MED134_03189 [Dokdonia sp. MED134]
MASRLEYELAKRKYSSVKYFPFPVDPGESFMLTSNPWNFLNTWLNNEIRKFKRSSDNSKRIEKSLYFLELAENFYLASEKARMPTRGTLIYYSTLNLVKVFLLNSGIDLEVSMEHHGLVLQSNEKRRLRISPSNDDCINIFAKFSELIGSDVVSGEFIDIDEMISEIPEVHEMTYNIGKLRTKKRKFLPVEIEIKTNKPRRSHLIYELKFEKKNSNLMRCEKFNTGVLSEKLDLYSDNGEFMVYRSKKRFNYTSTSDSSWRLRYKEIQDEIQQLGVSVILTRRGYRYYLNLQPNKYKPIVYYLSLMYYVGSVARYRPTLYKDILSGEYQAVFNETIETCSTQFLYYISSLITKKICAVPMAKLK